MPSELSFNHTSVPLQPRSDLRSGKERPPAQQYAVRGLANQTCAVGDPPRCNLVVRALDQGIQTIESPFVRFDVAGGQNTGSALR